MVRVGFEQRRSVKGFTARMPSTALKSFVFSVNRMPMLLLSTWNWLFGANGESGKPDRLQESKIRNDWLFAIILGNADSKFLRLVHVVDPL